MAIRQTSIRPQCNSCCPDAVVGIQLRKIGRFAELFHHAPELVCADTSIFEPHGFFWPLPESLRELEKSAAVGVKLTAVQMEGIKSVILVLSLVHSSKLLVVCGGVIYPALACFA